MALAGLTRGWVSLDGRIPPAQEQIRRFSAKSVGVSKKEAERLVRAAAAGGCPLHDALLTARGWPDIEFDGRLLVTQQDALLMGGKVQAMPGFADHVVFREPRLCAACAEKTCVAMCSGQAITQADGAIAFEREKCVHCGACLWNCARTNIEFRAGAGGLHSAEN
jgi:electron-transferring-flavoprotein dehydrogenase